jgi:hypothetical protein
VPTTSTIAWSIGWERHRRRSSSVRSSRVGASNWAARATVGWGSLRGCNWANRLAKPSCSSPRPASTRRSTSSGLRARAVIRRARAGFGAGRCGPLLVGDAGEEVDRGAAEGAVGEALGEALGERGDSAREEVAVRSLGGGGVRHR